MRGACMGDKTPQGPGFDFTPGVGLCFYLIAPSQKHAVMLIDYAELLPGVYEGAFAALQHSGMPSWLYSLSMSLVLLGLAPDPFWP